MSTKQTVEQEILSATGEKPKGKKEEASEYLGRTANATSDLKDAQYKALSKGAKAWFKQAADALNEEPPAPENIEAFDKYDDENEEAEVETSPADKKEKGKGKIKIPGEKVAKPEAAAPKKEEKKEEAEAPKIRQNSVADTIRHIMCDNPAVTKEQVGKELKALKLSFDVSRLDQVYSFTARVLEILQEKGKL